MSEPHLLEDVKKVLKRIKGKYYLQEWEERIPVCKGCFNEKEDCGTPCVNCERAKAWDKEWAWDLMIDNKYCVWKRKRRDRKMSEPAYKEKTIACPKCGTVLKLILTKGSEIVLFEVKEAIK